MTTSTRWKIYCSSRAAAHRDMNDRVARSMERERKRQLRLMRPELTGVDREAHALCARIQRGATHEAQ